MNDRQCAPCHDQAAIPNRAKAARSRSISAASRTLTGLTSTPSDGAAELDRAPLADPGGYCRIPKDRRSFYPRRDLL